MQFSKEVSVTKLNMCSDLLIDIIYSCGFKDNCSENFDICRKLSKTVFTVKEVTV